LLFRDVGDFDTPAAEALFRFYIAAVSNVSSGSLALQLPAAPKRQRQRSQP
jgi:hypothetical protein